MRVTPHSTLVIAFVLLHCYPSDNTLLRTFVQQYVETNKNDFGLSNIRWGGEDGGSSRLARVNWKKHDAFMKCDTTSSESSAFREMMKAKKDLKGFHKIGRHNVITPLHQFGFDGNDDIRYACHLYNYIRGETLDDYFRRHTISKAFITAAKILPGIIRGLIYLYNANLIHHDMFPKNIMIQKNSLGRIAGVKIIDMDGTFIPRKEDDWTPINPADMQYLSSNPRQQYASCEKLSNMIIRFLNVFVPNNNAELGNPFASNYKVTKESAEDYLEKFMQPQARLGRPGQSASYVTLELGDVNAAIPAIHYLLKARYTLKFDRFTCSSPMRALRGLKPRTL
ncbi:hypothetical protein BDF22DRAFT_745639 [Syncephalis plumigaleata]|nr:hypothetical protein BDF22DRAFT_745639 [Syncephalis plumigaleata]